jgi:hypothetical protein
MEGKRIHLWGFGTRYQTPPLLFNARLMPIAPTPGLTKMKAVLNHGRTVACDDDSFPENFAGISGQAANVQTCSLLQRPMLNFATHNRAKRPDPVWAGYFSATCLRARG